MFWKSHRVGSLTIKLKRGESQPIVTKEIQKLALTGIENAKPLLKDVIKLLLDEYLQTIKDITDEAIVEMLNSEIQKIAAEES